MASHLGEFEQLVLFALLRLQETAYGVSVRQEIEARTGREISAGAVYTALARLEGRGLVSSRVAETTPERGGRRRKYYVVTTAGAEMLQRSFGDISEMARGLLPQLADIAAGGTATE